MSSLSTRVLPLAIAAALAVQGCSRTNASEKQPLAQAESGQTSARDALSPATRTALDLGNSEYRAGRYENALKAYRDAAAGAPDNSAPYFGIFMAAQKLGNKTLADSATAFINSHSGATPMLSDSAMKALHEGGSAGPKPNG